MVAPAAAAAIEAELAALADPERAAALERFFKTGPGEYAEGDRFLGLTVPQSRAVARRHREAGFADAERLLASEWHEHRLVALLLLVDRYGRAGAAERERIARFYLDHRDRVDNWDLVDLSADRLLAEHAAANPGLLDELARSDRLWDRRIAVLTTFAQIKQGDAAEALRICESLLDDDEDLIHKACGWMLREVGKRCDVELLREFLSAHAARMPRTMLRYAIERLDEDERRRWLAVKRVKVAAAVR